jgi:hypothetical protein
MHSLWNALKTLTLTTLVAAMVWLFAEAETLRTANLQATVLVQARPQSASDGEQLVVDVKGAKVPQVREVTIRMEVEGAAARMDEAERILGSVPVILTLGDPAVPASTGEHSIDLLSALRSHPQLAELGVSVQRIEPASVDVMIDELMVRELPVRVALPEGGEFESAPVVSPPRVRVRLPKRDAEALPNDAAVELTVARAEFDRLTPGKAESLTGMRLRAPDALAQNARVTLTPNIADVQLTIRSRLVEHVLPRVPVALRMLPVDMAKWDVYLTPDEQYLSNVRVQGPGEVIDRVRDGSLVLTATVALSSDELQRGVSSKDVTFEGVPSSVRVTSAKRSVGVVISRR